MRWQARADNAAGLVGRDRERAAIDELIDAAQRGDSGSLVLRGDAGVGKSALLRYAMERAAGMTVLRVTGVEAESELGFAGLHGLVRPVEHELTRVPTPQREALKAALGLAPADGADRFLVSAGVLSLLSAASDRRPVLCAIDDAQWLDVPSADALVFTARRLGAEGVVMLFAAREGERRRFDARGLEQLVLSGLDAESAAQLLDRSARAVSDQVRSRLIQEAAGNPLALLELPGRLTPEQLAGDQPLPDALPLTDRLLTAFSQRIELLPDATRSVLLIAAIEEAGELPVTLRAAAELDLPSDALDPAERAGLVSIEGTALSFRHPLVRSAVHESEPLGRRRRAHSALADVLEQEQDVDRAIWHRATAASSFDEGIASALEASAWRSQRRGGHVSAARALERASLLTGASNQRGKRLLAAAEAAWLGGQEQYARELVGRALPIADRPQQARLLYLRGVIESNCGSLLDGAATMKQALTLSDEPSLTLEILRDGCAMASQAGAYEAARDFARRAAGITEVSLIDRFTKTSLAAWAAELSGEYARGRELAAELSALADSVDESICMIWAALFAAGAGLRQAMLHHGNRAVALARDQGDLTRLPFCLSIQAFALIANGRFELAYASAEEGRNLAVDIGQPWAAAWNGMDLAVIDALRGAEELTRTRVAELQTWVACSGASWVEQHAEYALALLHLGCGRPDEALDALLKMTATARLESNPVRFAFGVPDAVEAAVRTDRTDDIRRELDDFRAWAIRSGHSMGLALLARSEALLETEDAEPQWQRAMSLANALSPVEQGRTALLYGEWLRRQRRRIDARRHLRAALELFERLGAAPWEARARAELRASGETARRRDPSTRDQLTPQELQIARLVAGGKTNPEVAAQLFLSPRTIDYHLRKVFTKLDITSRAQLAELNLRDPMDA